jgi:hypothetical protein
MSEPHGADYIEGRKFRVMKEGARFEGLLLHGEQTISGWSRRISQGEVLTCLGWKTVDAFGAAFRGVMWTGLKVPDSAIVMQIWPFESIFRPYPLAGLLRREIDPDDEDAMAELAAEAERGYDPVQMKQVERPLELAAPPAPSLDEIDDGEEVDLTNHLPIIEKPKPDEEEIVDLSGF